MRRNILFFILMNIFSLLLVGQSDPAFNNNHPIVLTGTTIDKRSHDTVRLAIVDLLIQSNGIHATRSDLDGEFRISFCSGHLTNDLLRIQVTVQGYRQEIFEFKVSGDTSVNLELTPDPEGKITEQDVWIKYSDVIEGTYDVFSGYEKFRHCDGRIKTLNEIEESGEQMVGWEPYDFSYFNPDNPVYEQTKEIPDLAAGSFLHGFYHIDPAVIPQLNISRIEFSGKMHGDKIMTKTIHFDAAGKKTKGVYSYAGQSYEEHFDHSIISDFACPVDTLGKIYCNEYGRVDSVFGYIDWKKHTYIYDSLFRPVREEFLLNNGNKLVQYYYYTAEHRIDSSSVKMYNYEGDQINEEYYKYYYTPNGKLYLIVYAQQIGFGGGHPIFAKTTFMQYKYNKLGLIKSSRCKGYALTAAMKYRYFSGEAELR